ncbi:hypothetical protein JI742_08220 [Piscinibacter sp. Jin2]|uniref:Uncharacterized protein n=1 Tax=Aquariibacter lacus TaxID=2801332 RepID=A0A9X0XF12_9BURK|nr:hypothetical protein [Piscinibacter lacus]MBL0719873.1 hypothetical protein [Piscinibacter lacus]
MDYTPLAQLPWIDPGQIPRRMEAGHQHAEAVTAFGDPTGPHHTFIQARHAIQPWKRLQRLAVASAIAQRHRLASAAIPIACPARSLAADGPAHWR